MTPADLSDAFARVMATHARTHGQPGGCDLCRLATAVSNSPEIMDHVIAARTTNEPMDLIHLVASMILVGMEYQQSADKPLIQ